MLRPLDDERIARDGEVVRFSMQFMDAEQRALVATADRIFNPVGHRPGFVHSDAIAEGNSAKLEAWEARQRRIADAWKSPAFAPVAVDPHGSSSPHADARTTHRATASARGEEQGGSRAEVERVWEARQAWLRDAWRTPRP